MLAAERREAILRLLREHGAVHVRELSQRFHTSSSTIRRDLERLAVQGQLRRTYGGAVTLEAPPGFFRDLGDEARRVGQAAADSIRPGETVFIGPGRLCEATARFLCARDDLTIITNSLEVAWTLYQGSSLALVLTGGPVERPHGTLIGELASRAMGTMRADRLVMEVAGVGPLEGLTLDHFSRAELLRALLKTVARVTVLVAAERMGRAGPVWLGDVSDADVIITGREASASVAWDLSESGVKVTLV